MDVLSYYLARRRRAGDFHGKAPMHGQPPHFCDHDGGPFALISRKSFVFISPFALNVVSRAKTDCLEQ
jgi:hypothetical protein